MTVKWKNGDFLEFNGEPCVFIGYYNRLPVVRYTENADQSLAGCLDEIYAVDNLKKPESPQQREERERLEAAYDLYLTQCLAGRCDQFTYEEFIKEKFLVKIWLPIVDKTNYRK